MVSVVLFLLLQLFMISLCHGNNETIPPPPPPESFPRVKSVCLGGWLVIEGWMVPYLYHDIPNKDMLDGTNAKLKSVVTGKYLSAEEGGGTIVVADRPVAGPWETFKLWRVSKTTFQFRVNNNNFIGLGQHPRVGVVAKALTPNETETFQVIRNSKHKMLVRIRASDGHFLQVRSELLVTADYPKEETEWKEDDPSVFMIELEGDGNLRGEYQVVNGYDPETAQKVIKEHRDTFITEADFEWIKENGLDAVRIPVGYWIAYDPNPPKPFVSGSLAKLDQAVHWAEKYGIKVILDLHGAKGSQNGWQHSGAKDTVQEWGLTDDSIDQTVAVIDFLSSRYAKSPMFFGFDLLNEPNGPVVTLKMLAKYYLRAHAALRKHSSTAYAIFGSRHGSPTPPLTELYPYISKLHRSVIDVHFYDKWWPGVFDKMNAQQNIDYIRVNRTEELKKLMSSPTGWPLVYIGEWSLSWDSKMKSTKQQRFKYAEAQMDVWGNATFGWAFWSLKSLGDGDDAKYWNLERMISQGYMSLS